MAAVAGTSLQMAATRPCTDHSRRMIASGAAEGLAQVKFSGSPCISSVQPLRPSITPSALKLNDVVTRAMASQSGKNGPSGLPIDLRGQKNIFPSRYTDFSVSEVVSFAKLLCTINFH